MLAGHTLRDFRLFLVGSCAMLSITGALKCWEGTHFVTVGYSGAILSTTCAIQKSEGRTLVVSWRILAMSWAILAITERILAMTWNILVVA